MQKGGYGCIILLVNNVSSWLSLHQAIKEDLRAAKFHLT